MLAGAWGGWWAISYQPPMKARSRLSRILISAMAAGWIVPGVVALAIQRGWLPAAIDPDAIQFPAALLTGLLAVDVLGRGALRWAEAKAKEVSQ
jgi:hypothetical protein